MEYIATFFTHSGAIKYQRYLKNYGLAVELMPVPRKLSSNCGIAARFSFREDIKAIISVDIEKLYTIENNEYQLIYKASEE